MTQPYSHSPSAADSLGAKGAAITLMLIHHLFAFPDRLNGVSYISLFPMSQSAYAAPEFYLGQLAKICVSMFLFLSGFGMMQRMKTWEGPRWHYSLKKGTHFLMSYWIVFLLFIPIGLAFFQNQPRYQFSLYALIANFFGLSYSYNPEWWFVRTYFLLLAGFPFLSRFADKHPRFLGAMSLLLLLLSVKVRFLQNICLHQAAFIFGILFSQQDLFTKLQGYLFPKSGSWIFYALAVPLFAVRALFDKELPVDPFLAVLAVAGVLHALRAFPRLRGPLRQLGTYALPIWLTHSFFCYYFFQPLIFAPGFSVFITLWLLGLSLAVSILISKIQQVLSDRLPFSPRSVTGAS